MVIYVYFGFVQYIWQHPSQEKYQNSKRKSLIFVNSNVKRTLNDFDLELILKTYRVREVTYGTTKNARNVFSAAADLDI